jgi:hypothetical protein
MTGRGRRRHLRVPLQADVQLAWGFHRKRYTVTEFSPGGLTVKGIEAEVGTPVTVELPLPHGTFALCGVVVHHEGAGGTSGIRYLGLTPEMELDLELFLWDLLAATALPGDPNTCSVAGCQRPRKARGLCSLHYNRWRREQTRKQRD